MREEKPVYKKFVYIIRFDVIYRQGSIERKKFVVHAGSSLDAIRTAVHTGLHALNGYSDIERIEFAKVEEVCQIDLHSSL